MTVESFLGTERFMLSGRPSDVTLNDFWSWSSSDFSGNTLRGMLAEFIVAKALDVDTSKPRTEWDACDLYYGANGIEVKCSSFWQAWHYAKSPSIKFGISRAHKWDKSTGYDRTADPCRPSKVYVFCIFGSEIFSDECKDLNNMPSPLDLCNWSFRVLPTAVLDTELGNQKVITLGSLKKLMAKYKLNSDGVPFTLLRDAVDKALLFDGKER